MAPYIREMVQGYQRHGQEEEAWALTQETFEAHRASMSLAAPAMAPYIREMIQGYQRHGQEEEAWALTQETFEAHRASMSLAAPAMAPYIREMIQGYKRRGKHDEQLQLHMDISSFHAQQDNIISALEAVEMAKVAWKKLGCPRAPPILADLPQLVQRLFQRYGFGSRTSLLLQHIRINLDSMPLEWRMEFLTLDIPVELRQMITTHLKSCKSDVLLWTGDSSKFCLHRSVLEYWSEYFRTTFNSRWNSTEINLDSTIVSSRSLQVLVYYMYSGNYVHKDNADIIEDLQAADYLRIVSLKDRIEGLLKSQV